MASSRGWARLRMTLRRLTRGSEWRTHAHTTGGQSRLTAALAHIGPCTGVRLIQRMQQVYTIYGHLSLGQHNSMEQTREPLVRLNCEPRIGAHKDSAAGWPLIRITVGLCSSSRSLRMDGL